MRTYMISYDLAQPAHNQQVVAQAIMGIGEKWARPLQNTWYVTSEREEAELEGELKTTLSENDGLIIQAIKREAALTNTSLRWFRQRRNSAQTASATQEDSNVVVFREPQAPNPDAGEADSPELPFAQAC